MANQDNSSFSFPWPPLLGLLAAIAGLVALLPSKSARPPAGTMERALRESDGVSARLWQDPLQIAIEAQNKVFNPNTTNTSQPTANWEALRNQFKKSAARCTPLILMVCIPDSPYAEDVERRLRDRAALLQAMAASHYYPEESNKLHFLTFGILPPLPYETFIPFGPDRTGRNDVLVLWVADGLLKEKPLTGIVKLLRQLSKENDPPLDVRVLGPSSSAQYHSILKEIDGLENTPCTQDIRRRLSNTRIYSCKATATEDVLKNGLSGSIWGRDTTSFIESAIRQDTGKSGFRFIRTTATDDQLCDKLVREIGLRKPKKDRPVEVAVISELDSFYGNALIDAFTRSAATQEAHLSIYSYPAGIDGALPRNALGIEEKSNKDQAASKNAETVQQEAPEGQSQIDYFRRLADALEQKNHRLLRETGNGIGAVAVLGGDIYDKLQILRTLRPRLPGAIFLTNGLDARFGHPDERAETRNLIVASGHPLDPAAGLKNPAPSDVSNPLVFRDSYQSAVYQSALQALDPQSAPCPVPPPVHLYEVGATGPVELDVQPEFLAGKWFWLLVPALACIWLLHVAFRRTVIKPPAGFRPSAVWLARSELALPAALATSLMINSIRYHFQGGHPEPFALYDGISIWPGDFLRLFTFGLGVHFIFNITFRLESNASHLSDYFNLQDSGTRRKSAPGTFWKRCKRLFPRPCRHSPKTVNIGRLQRFYCNWGKPLNRAIRAFIYLVAYTIVIVALHFAFSWQFPDLPVRGDARVPSKIILILAVFVTLFVNFLVVDATRLNCFFIRDLNRARSKWNLSDPAPGKGRFKFKSHRRILHKADICDYLDIRYIAARSSTVNQLIYCPFVLFFLLIAARWSGTDDYPWPILLIVVFTLNLSFVIHSAIRLPREARNARDESLRRLRAKLLRREHAMAGSKAVPGKRSTSETLKATIAEIENLREGAFVGIWDQPLLKAILVPSGGAGLWALLDLLPRL